MRILVTNDDGIRAPGIRILAEWARKLGEVTVVAPKNEQSAMSQHVNLLSSFECRETDLFPGIRAWSVDSSPADCIRVADAWLQRDFDLVLAGINNGLNVGWDVVYSATCGACFEANYSGWKAIAFSTFRNGFDGTAKKLDDAWQFIREHDLLSLSDLLNVNFGHGDAGVVFTRQAEYPYFRDSFRQEEGAMIRAAGRSVYRGTSDLSRDLDAVMHGFTSVSPLTVARTDEAAYGRIRDRLGSRNHETLPGRGSPPERLGKEAER